ASSRKPAEDPAPLSTATALPDFTTRAAASGVRATRRSPAVISFGTATFKSALLFLTDARHKVDLMGSTFGCALLRAQGLNSSSNSHRALSRGPVFFACNGMQDRTAP